MTARNAPVGLLPDFCFHSLVMEKGSMGSLTLSPADLLFWTYLLMLCEEERIK